MRLRFVCLLLGGVSLLAPRALAPPARAQGRLGRELQATPDDVMVLVWPSAVLTERNRAQSELFLNTLATVWGPELSISLVEAVGQRTPPVPLTWEQLRQLSHYSDAAGAVECASTYDPGSGACRNHGRAEALALQISGEMPTFYLQRQFLRLPHEEPHRSSTFEPGGLISQFLHSLSDWAPVPGLTPGYAPLTRSRVVLNGIFEDEPIDDVRGLHGDQTVLVFLHGGDTASLRSDPLSPAWGEILRVDISTLDAGQAVRRACEVVGHRRGLRCSQPDEPTPMAHSDDARVSFRQEGEALQAVVQRPSDEPLLLLPLVPLSDSMPATVEGITLWEMPTSAADFRMEIEDIGYFPTWLKAELGEEIGALIAHGALHLELTFDGRPIDDDALRPRVVTGDLVAGLPALSVGEHRARLSLVPARDSEERLQVELRLQSLGEQVAGAFLRCVEVGPDAHAELKAFSGRRSGADLCFWIDWWSRDERILTASIQADEELQFVTISARQDLMFEVFVLVVLIVSMLLWWPTRRAKPATHLAFRVHQEGDFRSAPNSRWEIVQIRGAATLSSLHEALHESEVSLRTRVGRLIASGVEALVVQTPAGQLVPGGEHRLEPGMLLLEGERVYAFVDEKMAHKLKSGDWDVRVPDEIDVSVARSELIDSARRRTALLRRIGSVLLSLVVGASSLWATMEFSHFFPSLSQRGPFVVFSLSSMLLGALLGRLARRSLRRSILQRV